MPENSVQITVAQAKVNGEADLEVTAPDEVRVQVGQPLYIKYRFHFDEQSRDREAWKFDLASRIGDVEKGPSFSQWDDRWGLHDELWGELLQEYRFHTPGKYEGEFRVTAHYSRRGWSNKVKLQDERRIGRGGLRVVVTPSTNGKK